MTHYSAKLHHKTNNVWYQHFESFKCITFDPIGDWAQRKEFLKSDSWKKSGIRVPNELKKCSNFEAKELTF